jgi:hypothetical protein
MLPTVHLVPRPWVPDASASNFCTPVPPFLDSTMTGLHQEFRQNNIMPPGLSELGQTAGLVTLHVGVPFLMDSSSGRASNYSNAL